MANTAKILDLYTHVTGTPVGTIRDTAQHLRNHDLMPKGKRGRGATRYDTAAAINSLLATLLSPTASRAAETVQHVGKQRLRFVAGGEKGMAMAQALGIGILDNFATALRCVIDAMRRGELQEGVVSVDLYDAGNGCAISFMPNAGEDYGLFFGTNMQGPPIMKFTRVDGRMLHTLAFTLGPIEEAPPPPY